jgi:hypothetical protein
MTLEQIRKLCQEVVDRYDLQSNSDYHEGRKDDEIQVYLTIKFKAKVVPTKKVLDKM